MDRFPWRMMPRYPDPFESVLKEEAGISKPEWFQSTTINHRSFAIALTRGEKAATVSRVSACIKTPMERGGSCLRSNLDEPCSYCVK